MQNRTMIWSLIFFVLVAASADISAQEADIKKEISAAVKKEDKIENLKISGKIRMEARADLKDQDDPDATRGRTFDVTSAYLKFNSRINDLFSIMIRGDAVQGTPDDNGDKGTASEFMLKNAYLQARGSLSSLSLIFRSGLIGTPVINYIDSISGFRWISKNYIDSSKHMFGNQSSVSLNDSSADLGVSLGLDAAKILSISYAVTNGEGYKKVKESDANSGKAQYGLLTVTPLAGLSLYGFARHEVEQVKNSMIPDPTTRDTAIYYGGGAAWKSSLIKIGGYYLLGNHKTDGKKDHKLKLMDLWVNINCKKVTGLPFLLYGRFARGEDEKGIDAKTGLWSAGAGYRFHRNVTAGLYYEEYTFEKGPVKPAAAEKDKRTFYVKTEVKF